MTYANILHRKSLLSKNNLLLYDHELDFCHIFAITYQFK